LLRYGEHNSDLNKDAVARLENAFEEAEALLLGNATTHEVDQHVSAAAAHTHYVQLAKAHCRSIWSTFDVGRILIGLAIMAATVVLIGLELFIVHRETLCFRITADAATQKKPADDTITGIPNTGAAATSAVSSTDPNVGAVRMAEDSPSTDGSPVAKSNNWSLVEKELVSVPTSGGPAVRYLVRGATVGVAVGAGAIGAGLLPCSLVGVALPTTIGALSTHLLLSAQSGRYGAMLAYSKCSQQQSNGGWGLLDIRTIATACATFQVVCCFSNSFVVHSDLIATFLATSLVLALAVREAREGGVTSAIP
jgi:hypothetical protein